MALSLPRRMLHALYVYTGLEPYNTMGPPPAGPYFPAGSLHDLTGPAARHPERIRHDIPLTPLERTLRRELRSR
ncbi:DUF6059 family protein [Streptomyces carpinensis]|uniref:DUF6059 family protein n=1 Tax=Streptomyces carpinensis TaxID=66369 RepID=A0ABV1WJ39_9ACTN|nr:DUF6059 family protein [Streptomyces carpinensis]